ncbi:MAG: hypothetical protein GXY85_03245 [Candidatus Brocadiaceae bacterium]|nr:hypothetical protein [Candidatus Brocadiaceae bacterium]
MTDPTPGLSRAERMDRARVLEAEGVPTRVIAAAVGRSPDTIRRWRRAARAPAASTDGPRPARPGRASPAELRARLERRLAALVDEGDEPEKGAEDRMLKICRILEFLQGAQDLDAQLRVVRDFAVFCLQALTEDEMQPVRKAIHMYLDKLKRENQ